MNTTPTSAAPPDNLDRLFSEFFKAEMKHPWPKAPSTAPAARPAEPSELAALRAAGSSRNEPAPAAKGRDHTARARFTLAASVALALGATWFLSNGFEPAARQGNAPAQGTGPMLPGGSASGQDDLRLKEIENNKLKGDAPKMDPGKFE